jgi:hypothetical protein
MPDPVLSRFVAIARALDGSRRWYQGADAFRYAAVPLTAAEGPPEVLAGQVQDAAGRLRRGAGWFSSMNSQTCLLVAALLVRDGVEAEVFEREFERARRGFRRLGLRRSELHELFAAVLLRSASGGVLPEGEVTWRRLDDAWRQMRQHHAWWTGPDDYPAAALIAAGDIPIREAILRIERIYDGLRRRGVGRGNVLQLVSHVLHFRGGDPERSARRFLDLKQALSTAGVWIWRCDLDEIALLATLDVAVHQLVREVVDDRQRIKHMQPRPGGVASFSMACGTTFLRHARPDQVRLHDLQVAMQMLELVRSQGSSAAVAASAG